MKRKHIAYLLILTVLSTGVFIVIKYIQDIKNEYINDFMILKYHKDCQYYEDLFFQYYLDSLECIRTLDEMIDIIQNDSTFEIIKRTFFTDYLSREKDDYIQYIPLYNRKNIIREAFLIISRGIDGKRNLKINGNDTIYIDEIDQRFNFYNKIEKNIIFKPIDSSFNMIDYLFGKKDYCIQYFNCIDVMRNQRIMNMQRITTFLENKNLSFKFIGFKGEYVWQETDNKHKYIFLKNDDYQIACEMYDDFSDKYNVGDVVELVGVLYDYNLETKKIAFQNCVFPFKRK